MTEVNKDRPRPFLRREHYAQIPLLVEQGMRRPDIARKFGVTPSTLQVQCCRRGISLRPGGKYTRKSLLALGTKTLPLSEPSLVKLREAARSRGLCEVQLATEILGILADDEALLDSVIGDGIVTSPPLAAE